MIKNIIINILIIKYFVVTILVIINLGHNNLI